MFFVALSIALTFFLSVAFGIETNLWVLGLLLVVICMLGALLEFLPASIDYTTSDSLDGGCCFRSCPLQPSIGLSFVFV